MPETADLLHHVPGRLRLRVPSAKGSRPRMEAIRNALTAIAGVRSVDVNPLLGTALVLYDPALFPEFRGALEAYAEERDLFTFACEDATGPCVSSADRSVVRVLGSVNRSVQQAMGNSINLKELVPIAIGAYAAMFADRKAAAAQWLNWIQFAFDTYMSLHENEPIEELDQKLDSLAAHIVAGQQAALESVRSEFAAVRTELRLLSDRLPAP